MKAHSNRNKDKTGLCFLLLCVMGLVCSCSREGGLSVDGEPVEAAFAGSFVREGWGDAERAGTRVSDGTWTEGDAVGVYMVPSSSYDLTGAMWKNRKQVIGSDNKMTPDGIANKLYYPLNGSDVRFVAYYPYTASASETVSLNKVSVDFADQSTKEKKEAKDFMFHRGTADYSKANPNASLGFHHKFSKILMTVRKDADEPSSLSDLTVTLKGMPATATVDLDRLATQQIDSITPGSAGDITAYTHSTDDKDDVTVEAIVVPHKGTGSFTNRVFTFTVGSAVKTYALPDTVTFESGKVYDFLIILGTCEITYDANDGTGEKVRKTVFTNVASPVDENTFPQPADSPAFYRWNTESDGTGAVYKAGATITPSEDVTLYARREVVTIDVENGTISPNNDGSVTYDGTTFNIVEDFVGYVVTGSTVTGGNSNRITVKSGVTATVTMKDATINVSGCAFYMVGANVTMVLEGTNVLTSNGNPGIYVPSGANLTITSIDGDKSFNGSLTVTVTGQSNAAGIGGHTNYRGGGNVTINGGTVTTTGGSGSGGAPGGGAGIGGCGGPWQNGGAGGGGIVTINGGFVTARGGSGSYGGGGAGIGGGGGGDSATTGGTGGTVYIDGVVVTETGSTYDNGEGSNPRVIAIAGRYPSAYAHAIGSGTRG